THEFHLPHVLILTLAVGGNWPGPPNSTTVFPDTLFVDYVRVYGLSTAVGSIEDKKDDHSLSQNYPNPLHSTTTISFNLPSKTVVSLKVFNSKGKEVATLESKELSAGYHERQWDATRFSNGIYYYRLQAGEFIESKKLIVLK
ncbi:MAG TPA: T9SS type A sorting domain-containing protein, partial [Prolixibacteraceae bacterium]|nr:T9SS type A sorting domain-containing protein [Prolixibacteraceae bacterium]